MTLIIASTAAAVCFVISVGFLWAVHTGRITDTRTDEEWNDWQMGA